MSIDELIALTFGHLTEEGLDDIFKPPLLNAPIEELHLQSPGFERELQKFTHRFLRHKKAKEFSTPLHLNIPKGRHTYRRASLLDIVDLVRYTALVFGIAETIESARIPKQNSIVFSSRFVRSVPAFDKRYGHNEFRRQSDILTKSGTYSVKIYTDISNFFDRLNLHKLESTLTAIGCDHSRVKLLNEILLHWSGRNSYGIPVGCDASRILAEAMLINVDNKLLEAGATFVRYVDDYRIFATGYAEAHGLLAALTSALEDEGLFINGAKTRITSVESEAPERGAQDPNRSKSRFEKLDEAEAIEIRRIVGTGYHTRIAKYYHFPGKDAIKRLRENNQEELLAKCLRDEPNEEDLKEYVKTIIYSESRDPLDLLLIADRHIHIIAYIVDALTKEGARFTPDERTQISCAFAERYEKFVRVDYYRLCIARLVSHEYYSIEGVFRKWFSRLPLNANPTFVKELIGFFGKDLSRQAILDLVSSAENFHPAVTRIIVSYALESANCGFPERRAWAKRWLQSNKDPLVRALCVSFLEAQEV